MIIIIDGYNLLKQVLPEKNIGMYEREQFIKQLSMYAHKKKHQVIIVFDAGPFVRPTREVRDAVQVVYSGCHESADDYIYRYVEKHKAYDMLLISSDRELRKKVATCAAVEALSPERFYPLFLREIRDVSTREARKETLILTKTSKEVNAKVDALMAEFATLKSTQKNEDHETNIRGKKAHKGSKKERKLFMKIKKL